MTHRQRVLAAMRHQRPDRIPFDLGSTLVTGITKNAYLNLAKALRIDPGVVQFCDVIQQLPVVCDNILAALDVDIRGLIPNFGRKNPKLRKDGDTVYFIDEWSVKWEKPDGALYFSVAESPLARAAGKSAVDNFAWPDPAAGTLLEGLPEKARRYRKQGYAIILESLCAGIFEMCCRVRGTEQFMMDLAMDPDMACALMDRFVDLKIRYYESAARQLAPYVNFIREVDDIAGQHALLVSPSMYRDLIKPRHQMLFEAQRRLFGDDFFVFFHSDGAIFEIIPDMIEIGIDVLNPVQVTADGMEATRLKSEYGKDLCFWGGGVDTQHVLPHASGDEVKDCVRRAIAALAPDGGFIFGAVHNIQDDVPVENILAMLEAFNQMKEYN
jgi:uroporphyrinogen decarboxylase